MSSQPRDPAGAPRPPKPKWYSYWPKWRRIMMAGALTLLAGALVPAIMGGEDKAPTWLPNATLIIGYGMLAYGFFLAMRARSTGTQVKKEERAEVLEEET